MDQSRPHPGHLRPGHPAPLLVSGEQAWAEQLSGPGAGHPRPQLRLEARTVEVGEQWTLLCYTDGLVEGLRAPGSMERFAIEAVASTRCSTACWPPSAAPTEGAVGRRRHSVLRPVRRVNRLGPAPTSVPLQATFARSAALLDPRRTGDRSPVSGERHPSEQAGSSGWPEARQDRRRRWSWRWRRRSRRAGTMPARRCSTSVGRSTLDCPPPALAAMLRAPTRSRCPWNLQCGQRNSRPLGLGTRRRQDGQVEEVPRSSTSRTTMPARSALSRKACSRCVRRHRRKRKFCIRPTFRSLIPVGSPTTKVPTRCCTTKATTCLAASCWACWTRRRWWTSARRRRAR